MSDPTPTPDDYRELSERRIRIQELMRHADLSMTERYTHLSPAARESAVRLLDSRLA